MKEIVELTENKNWFSFQGDKAIIGGHACVYSACCCRIHDGDSFSSNGETIMKTKCDQLRVENKNKFYCA